MSDNGNERGGSLRLSPAEVRAVHLWRRLGYGELRLRIQAGEPIQADGQVQIRLDRPEHSGAVDTLTSGETTTQFRR